MAVKQFAVIGLGRFGWRVAVTLAEAGAEVLAIDRDPTLVQEIAPFVSHAAAVDTTDERAMRALHIETMDAAVVAIGENVEASILTVSLLAEIKTPLIIARAFTGVQARILEKVGASRVVYPEDEVAVNVANGLMSEHILDYIALPGRQSVVRMEVPDKFVGRTLQELHLRARFGVTVVSILRARPTGAPDETMTPDGLVVHVPGPDHLLHKDDVMILFGSAESIRKLEDSIK